MSPYRIPCPPSPEPEVIVVRKFDWDKLWFNIQVNAIRFLIILISGSRDLHR